MAALPADAELRFRPQDYRSKATFELIVEASQTVRPGKSTLVTESAFATRVRGLTPGNSDGLEIHFFTKPITEASRTDLLANDARELKKGSHAVLVLFLGKDGRVWQANLAQVMPGTTVGRTVAWKPEGLAQLAPFRFDGARLRLRSKGVYRESGAERLTMSWEVDVDLPVFDPAAP